MGISSRASGARVRELAVSLQAPTRGGGNRRDAQLLVVGAGVWPPRLHRLRRVPPHLDGLLHGSLCRVVGVCQALCCFRGHVMVLFLPLPEHHRNKNAIDVIHRSCLISIGYIINRAMEYTCM